MKIGIMGPKDSIDKVLELKEEFEDDVDFISFEAHTLEDSAKMYNQCKNKVDGILFTGTSVYDSVYQVTDIDQPHRFVPHNESSLFSIIYNDKDHHIKDVSIDVVDENIVEDVVKETHIENFQVLSHHPGRTEQDYIDFHDQNLKDHEATTVFTTFSPIYEYYKAKDVSVYRLYTTKFAIRNTINHLINDIKTAQLDDAKISIQIIKLDIGDHHSKTRFESLDKVLTFEKELVNYLKIIEGAIFNLGWNEYMIFTTKGYINNTTARNQFNKIILKSQFKIHSGIGIGRNASEAEYNALDALQHAEDNSDSCFFIIYEDQTVEGPILKDNELKFNNINKHSDYEKVSQETGLSINHLKKIESIKTLYKKDEFASSEIAHYLGVGERSARRILKKIIDGGYGQVIGKKNKPGAGRPENIIKIHDF